MNFPSIQLAHLDHLWFQVSGTLCNLACTHCFNSSGPGVRTFGMLSHQTVEDELAKAVELGVREVFFTGGEPFMHKELPEFLALSLKQAPTTVLTNGLLITDKLAGELAQMERASRYSLEIRISLDGYTAEMNDPIRGEGVFHRVLEATARLSRHELLPLMTIVRTWPDEAELETVAAFTQILRDAGYARPRIKIIPALPLGRELTRTGSHQLSFVTEEMLRGFDRDLLMCSNSRIVTDRGVWVCPLLVEKPDARMGSRLVDSLGSYELRHPACHSCYLYGTFCQNINSLVEGRVETS